MFVGTSNKYDSLTTGDEINQGGLRESLKSIHQPFH